MRMQRAYQTNGHHASCRVHARTKHPRSGLGDQFVSVLACRRTCPHLRRPSVLFLACDACRTQEESISTWTPSSVRCIAHRHLPLLSSRARQCPVGLPCCRVLHAHSPNRTRSPRHPCIAPTLDGDSSLDHGGPYGAFDRFFPIVCAFAAYHLQRRVGSVSYADGTCTVAPRFPAHHRVRLHARRHRKHAARALECTVNPRARTRAEYEVRTFRMSCRCDLCPPTVALQPD